MTRRNRWLTGLAVLAILLALLSGCAPQAAEPAATAAVAAPDEAGTYTAKDDVALYLHTYGRLPDNFVTKPQARALGWEGGGLEQYASGKCIGGDAFGNFEGLLPEADGRTYAECDIGTLGSDSRGAKRIVYSNDGLIYYTDDHYESFTLLYGSP
jgi:ribonuclease T1